MKRHQSWEDRGHTWVRLAYINDAGQREQPPYWWRCDVCGGSGYGETRYGGSVRPYNLIALQDGVWAKQGFRPTPPE